jgi:hypothetical protein
MALSFSEVLGPLLSDLSDIYNMLLTSEDPAIRFLSISAGLALYVFFVWHFYRKIACRDMAGFVPEQEEKTWVDKAKHIFAEFFYVIKYLIIFPMYSFFWLAFIAIAMALLNPGQDYEMIFFVSALIISTTRILAYIKEPAAREIAKLLPLVFISSVLLDQLAITSPLDLEKMIAQHLIPLTIQYFQIIIPLEIGLRLLFDAKKIIFRERIGGASEMKACPQPQKKKSKK